jgi:hypothetical protein
MAFHQVPSAIHEEAASRHATLFVAMSAVVIVILMTVSAFVASLDVEVDGSAQTVPTDTHNPMPPNGVRP